MLGIAVVAVLWKRRAFGDTLIVGTLVFFWLVTGVGYHLLFFSSINGLAIPFGVLFVLEAGLLAWVGFRHPGLSFRAGTDVYSLTGGLFVLYALIVYPIAGALLGHGYPASPSFGVTPCPTTIFTLGLLLLAEPPLPKRLIVIPFLWSLLGATAPVLFGVVEDYGLLVTGLLSAGLILWRDHHVAPRSRSQASHA
ncbi:MAG: hypothetical protein HY329_19755 [Chloroflexi bacterium]|nr:hypothetical protein [Chloroflexota bacterium]